MDADLILLAMGFTGPVKPGLVEQLGVQTDVRGNTAAKLRLRLIDTCAREVAAASYGVTGELAKNELNGLSFCQRYGNHSAVHQHSAIDATQDIA